jgi:hypothetical protein
LIRVAVCGSDEWTNKELVWSALDRLEGKYTNLTVVTRGNNGVDGYATGWAASKEQPRWNFLLELQRFGAIKGIDARIDRIVNEARPTHVLVCPGAATDKRESHYLDELNKAGAEMVTLQHKADVIRLVIDNKPKPITPGPASAA